MILCWLYLHLNFSEYNIMNTSRTVFGINQMWILEALGNNLTLKPILLDTQWRIFLTSQWQPMYLSPVSLGYVVFRSWNLREWKCVGTPIKFREKVEKWQLFNLSCGKIWEWVENDYVIGNFPGWRDQHSHRTPPVGSGNTKVCLQYLYL